MKFQVPQFIEVEDKVIGPLSFKQFIYVVGGLGLAFLLYSFLPLLIALPLILVALALSGALAFYKINNKPFVFTMEAAIRYTLGGKLYVWRKKPKKVTKVTDPKSDTTNVYVPKLSDSKLRDLAWSLDVNDFNKSGTNTRQ